MAIKIIDLVSQNCVWGHIGGLTTSAGYAGYAEIEGEKKQEINLEKWF